MSILKQLVAANLDDQKLTAPWDGKAVGDWLGNCLMVVRSVFRVRANKYTAWEEWEVTQGRHLDRNLPSGAAVLVWFEHWGTYYDPRIKKDRYGNWGHVVVYEDGVFSSSPISHKPYFDKWTTIEQIEQKYRAKFVGWSEYLGDTRVAEQAPDPAPAPPAPSQSTVSFPASISSWAVYKVGSGYRKGTSDQVGSLNPAKFGGLTYPVVENRGNVVVIDTQNFGRVAAWVKDTVAVIR